MSARPVWVFFFNIRSRLYFFHRVMRVFMAAWLLSATVQKDKPKNHIPAQQRKKSNLKMSNQDEKKQCCTDQPFQQQQKAKTKQCNKMYVLPMFKSSFLSMPWRLQFESTLLTLDDIHVLQLCTTLSNRRNSLSLQCNGECFYNNLPLSADMLLMLLPFLSIFSNLPYSVLLKSM